ncbi:ParB N-terminal domain-containing protein [Promicromonospora kroppenstedtii]|uniref:ParB N-terminal domain-containing protein n=1 Tax=Promicromonospora kroppenstedtii TaxID=440482 RepID=UPI0004AC56F3|nr:ParB N-terminal domain-containing protein [Promicromonospora kroppenstedtii]
MPNEADALAGALTVTVDSIIVGARHRKDAGDLDSLAASIDQLGLLQPITVTPDRVLVCGWRRLEAVKRLGWRSVEVWVRSGISDPVTALLAERDENTQRKDYTPLEKEALYREIKELLREDAARRQAETRFGGTRRNENKKTSQVDADGGVHRTPPGQPAEPTKIAQEHPGQGKVREQAALIVTGRKSQNTLERLSMLVDLTRDATRPDHIRSLATAALARIQDGHPVFPEYEAVRATLAATDPDQQTIEPVTSEDVQELLATVKKNENRHRASDNNRSKADNHDSDHSGGTRRSVPSASLRQWAAIWPGLKGWTTQYNPTVIAEAASETDWDTFREVLAETNAFARAAEAARTTKRPNAR